MRAYRPDRVVKALSGLATGLYFLTWVFAVIALVLIPVARVLAVRERPPASGWSVQFDMGGMGVSNGADARIAVPVRLIRPRLSLPAWRGGGQVEVSEVRGTASVPMASLSVGFVALVWAALAVFLALVLLFLHQLRLLFRRVRQGAPFDPDNAVRLRWLGMLLLAAAVWKGATDFWMSLAVSRMLEGPGDQLGTALYLNGPVIFVALVLMALAEIFRRGAALEDEQSLVV